jgi:hypothetical protein
MDGLEFSTEIVKAAAWPLTVVVVVRTFRAELKEIIRRLKSVEGPAGVKAILAEQVFAQETKEVAQELKAVADKVAGNAKVTLPSDKPSLPRAMTHDSVPKMPPQMGPDDRPQIPSPYWEQYLKELGEMRRPAADVILEWQKLEALLTHLGMKHGIRNTMSGGVGGIAAALYEHKVIPLELVSVIQKLRALRNQVAQVQFEPDRAAADEYMASARRVAEVLEKAAALPVVS